MIMTLPNPCDATFDNTNDDHLDNWQFSYQETGMQLICSDCNREEDV